MPEGVVLISMFMHISFVCPDQLCLWIVFWHWSFSLLTNSCCWSLNYPIWGGIKQSQQIYGNFGGSHFPWTIGAESMKVGLVSYNDVECTKRLLPETDSSPLKRWHLNKERIVFQAFIFKGELLLSGRLSGFQRRALLGQLRLIHISEQLTIPSKTRSRAFSGRMRYYCI